MASHLSLHQSTATYLVLPLPKTPTMQHHLMQEYHPMCQPMRTGQQLHKGQRQEDQRSGIKCNQLLVLVIRQELPSRQSDMAELLRQLRRPGLDCQVQKRITLHR